MRKRSGRRNLAFLVTGILIAGVAYAATAIAAPATGTKADRAQATKVALVLHLRIPFTQQIADGAIQAAKENGLNLQIVGPAGFDPPAAVVAFNQVILAGAKGVAAVSFPPEIWRRTISNAVKRGIPVGTLNAGAISTLGSKSPVYVGVNEVSNGRALGTLVGRELGPKAGGTVIVGTCAPGLYVLDDRVKGIKLAVKKLSPKITVKGPFDVSGDPTKNFNTWKSIILANPSAKAFLGVCAPDLPNLSKIKRQDKGAKYIIAGVDLEPEALRGIKDGLALGTIGQSPYMQGYVPIRLIAEKLAEGKPIPSGWIDAGLEVVTKKNVKTFIARENSKALTKAWYQPAVERIFADPASAAKPYAEQRK